MTGLTRFWLVLVAPLPKESLVTMLLVPTPFHPAAFFTSQLPGETVSGCFNSSSRSTSDIEKRTQQHGRGEIKALPPQPLVLSAISSS